MVTLNRRAMSSKYVSSDIVYYPCRCCCALKQRPDLDENLVCFSCLESAAFLNQQIRAAYPGYVELAKQHACACAQSSTKRYLPASRQEQQKARKEQSEMRQYMRARSNRRTQHTLSPTHVTKPCRNTRWEQ